PVTDGVRAACAVRPRHETEATAAEGFRTCQAQPAGPLSSLRVALQESRGARSLEGLGTGGDAELAVDGLDVAVHGAVGHEQLTGNVGLAEVTSQEGEDGELA